MIDEFVPCGFPGFPNEDMPSKYDASCTPKETWESQSVVFRMSLKLATIKSRSRAENSLSRQICHRFELPVFYCACCWARGLEITGRRRALGSRTELVQVGLAQMLAVAGNDYSRFCWSGSELATRKCNKTSPYYVLRGSWIPGEGMGVLQNFQKFWVRVWTCYRAHRSPAHCGTGIQNSEKFRAGTKNAAPVPQVLWHGSCRSYRTSGYGHESLPELPELPGIVARAYSTYTSSRRV